MQNKNQRLRQSYLQHIIFVLILDISEFNVAITLTTARRCFNRDFYVIVIVSGVSVCYLGYKVSFAS